MTNAQKWVASFLGLFLVLFLLGRFTRKEEMQIPQQMGEQPTQSSGNVDGLTMIKQIGCISCHGENLKGTQLAPELVNLKQFWTRDALINYLRNPQSYSRDIRFDDYRAKYKNVMMPSYGNIDVKELGKIADYLLTR
ncbi:MAG: cytochrome c [Ignavibacteriales bacterium]|nr:cytochrome c [Ignavibacteriales bacterium]